VPRVIADAGDQAARRFLEFQHFILTGIWT
jgi:hypothetical protein